LKQYEIVSTTYLLRGIASESIIQIEKDTNGSLLCKGYEIVSFPFISHTLIFIFAHFLPVYPVSQCSRLKFGLQQSQ